MKIELTKEQIDFLNRFTKEGTWKINTKTGLVDIKGKFDCSESGLENFKGVRFGVVTGDFDCSFNQLKSLIGAPQKVGEDFKCYMNKLTSLEGAPQKVGRSFYCDRNKLTSLIGAPQEVKGYFDCSKNKLTSLEGAPQEVGEDFDCSCNKLTSFIGGPQEVKDRLFCHNNKLTSLEGAPKKCGYVDGFRGNLVDKEILNVIWERMQTTPNYHIALASLKTDFEKQRQKELDEINSRWEILSQIGDDDLAKGASILGRIGAF